MHPEHHIHDTTIIGGGQLQQKKMKGASINRLLSALVIVMGVSMIFQI